MVMASPNPIESEKIQVVDDLPIIDLSAQRSEVSKLMVKACEDYGFFKVINHGIPENIISAMEEEGLNFFAKPAFEKQRAGPANPFGYGCKNIGFNGDVGDVEYLLLHTNPLAISQTSNTVSIDPIKFRLALSCYIEAIKEVACKVLNLMAEGLWIPDTSVFSRMMMDVDSESLFRINHYPPNPTLGKLTVGFGEHSDPQILTILKSNDVAGLQVCVDGRLWVTVAPDPTAFFVNVGDLLQAMTNGRFMSVRHRVLTNSCKSRMSMGYFVAPPLHAQIAPAPNTVTPLTPPLYRPFTWAEYKKATYSLRLGDERLDLFRFQ